MTGLHRCVEGVLSRRNHFAEVVLFSKGHRYVSLAVLHDKGGHDRQVLVQGEVVAASTAQLVEDGVHHL